MSSDLGVIIVSAACITGGSLLGKKMADDLGVAIGFCAGGATALAISLGLA